MGEPGLHGLVDMSRSQAKAVYMTSRAPKSVLCRVNRLLRVYSTDLMVILQFHGRYAFKEMFERFQSLSGSSGNRIMDISTVYAPTVTESFLGVIRDPRITVVFSTNYTVHTPRLHSRISS